MTIIETLKLLDNGTRAVVLTDSGHICVLALSEPVPLGYKLGTVDIPACDEASVFDATPKDGMFVPVIPVLLQISQGHLPNYIADPSLFRQ